MFAILAAVAGAGLLAPVLTQVRDAVQVAPVALVTEFLRQARFGLILGLAYPVLRGRHRTDQDGTTLMTPRIKEWRVQKYG
jgi:hypothetical protein